jgi:hypothetical protein
MSKMKEIYVMVNELLAEIEDGAIDMDQAYEDMLAVYPTLSLNHIEFIFNEVMETDGV